MIKIRKVISLMLLLCFFLVYPAQAQENIVYPKPTEAGYVNDYADILTGTTEQNIASLGYQLDSKTKAQIVVVTLNKLPSGVTIEEYANGLFREWGIGDKKLKNGILILVNIDSNDRAIRTEVGDGLEGRIPDAVSNRITNEIIIPYFQNGDYDTGLLKGYYEICGRVAGEYGVTLSVQPDPVKRTYPSTGRSNLPIIIAVVIMFVFDGVFLRWRILRLIMYIIASSRFRGGGGGGGFGGMGGGSGGGFGGFGGGKSSGGGSTGRW